MGAALGLFLAGSAVLVIAVYVFAALGFALRGRMGAA